MNASSDLITITRIISQYKTDSTNISAIEASVITRLPIKQIDLATIMSICHEGPLSHKYYQDCVFSYFVL